MDFEALKLGWFSLSVVPSSLRVELEFTLIFIPALPQHAPHGCCTRLPVPSACCLLPLHVASPPGTAWGPLTRTPLAAASVPLVVMLGVAEAGEFSSVSSSPARQFL